MRNDFESNYLMHHGIYGQKWGVRRFQNPDGSLTEAGRKRYGVGAGEGIGDIRSEKGTKRRIKDVKKSIAKNNKARGKEYSKIANNPENFLGLNKKHGKKIEEYSENIKKGEEEIKRLKERMNTHSKEMGEVSNKIVDMILDGASREEIAKEVNKSMQIMSKDKMDARSKEMGEVSNKIVDMTLNGASREEIAQEVEASANKIKRKRR